MGAALTVLMLAACGKTSNSSTDSGTCNYNALTGYSTNSATGAICSSTAATTNCIYNGATGTYVNATTGGVCSTTSTGTCVLAANGYYINQTTGQICSTTTATGGYTSGLGTTGYTSASCDYWTQMYGVYYTPAYLNGQVVCVASY